jgi:hypothetical protein
MFGFNTSWQQVPQQEPAQAMAWSVPVAIRIAGDRFRPLK